MECAAKCAKLNCASFSFDTASEICTIYGNASYGGWMNVTTGIQTAMMQRQGPLVDCSDLCCTNCSGVYSITPVKGTTFDVYCETDIIGGPWTVIQRRFDGSVDFYRNWEDYKQGFGNVNGEYWLGLEYIYSLLQLDQRLYILLESWNGTAKHAEYESFSIKDESFNYNLTIDGFSGNVVDKFSQHGHQQFSTYDRDNDITNRTCASFARGGFWYRNCYAINLNGIYMMDEGTDERRSMNWNHFFPDRRQMPLRKCSMMIKRRR
ncbi:angiopoietin-related protein 1-like [Argopecten irradians]|uniref:angiopoietin-related protein 1-like n=1 Tax=Argopecten irradians TaxID=31199 RepID=UPI003720F95B